jgi:hypothetical protein
MTRTVVTADMLGTDAVTEEKIADGAVTEDKIGAAAVGSAALGATALALIGTPSDGSVTSAKLAASAISGQTEDTAPDAAADYTLTYDASTGLLKKVALAALPGTWVLLSTQTPSGVAQVDFTQFDSTKYSKYWLSIEKIAPATDNVELYLRVSTNGGSSYLAGGQYHWSRLQNQASSTAASGLGGASANQASLANAMGNGTDEAGVFEIFITPTSSLCYITYSSLWTSETPAHAGGTGSAYVVAASVNALRMLMSSGNVASGTLRFYGLRK